MTGHPGTWDLLPHLRTFAESVLFPTTRKSTYAPMATFAANSPSDFYPFCPNTSLEFQQGSKIQSRAQTCEVAQFTATGKAGP